MSIKSVVMVCGVIGGMAGSAMAQDKIGGGAPASTAAAPSAAAPVVAPAPVAASSAQAQAQPTQQPYVAPAPQPQPYPGAAQPYPAQPQPYPAQPQPYPAQPYGPGYQQPGYARPSPLGRGATFEANLGLGWLRFAPDDFESSSEGAIGGLNLGIGGWISPRTALTVRIASATYSEGDASITGAFFGGALQYWASENAWLGAGVGLGLGIVQFDDGFDSESDSESGLGLDFRVGYTPLISGQHSLNFSFEVNPTFLDGVTLTGIALLVGYQYL
jgi:hypothetical protein